MNRKNLLATVLIFISITIKSQAQMPMRAMDKYVGDWKVQYIMWMDPSQPPMNSELTVHREMLMNGLFLSSHYTGNSMGMRYEALSTMGYSMEKKMYVSSWIDNQNSGINYSEGKASTDGKSIEFHGSTVDPVSGKEILTRQVLTFVDDTHQKIEFFKTTDGKEMKVEEYDLAKE